MADITKRVDRGIPPNQRSQNFTEADAGDGDIILVKESLGKTANTVLIETAAEMVLRFNVKRTMYPPATLNDGLVDGYGSSRLLLGSGLEYTDESNGTVTLLATETLELKDDLPVNDIQILTVSGVFDIFVS
jgi:hypothetical protein